MRFRRLKQAAGSPAGLARSAPRRGFRNRGPRQINDPFEPARAECAARPGYCRPEAQVPFARRGLQEGIVELRRVFQAIHHVVEPCGRPEKPCGDVGIRPAPLTQTLDLLAKPLDIDLGRFRRVHRPQPAEQLVAQGLAVRRFEGLLQGPLGGCAWRPGGTVPVHAAIQHKSRQRDRRSLHFATVDTNT